MNQIKIGKFISECRKEKKLTQEQFAENIGVNSRSISRWETGKCMPDLSLYDSICNELDITINELLSGEHIKKDDYQKTFEKNVIEVVDKVERNNKYSNIITNVFLGIIVFFTFWFIGYLFYTNVKFKQDYKESIMFVDKDTKINNLMFNVSENGTLKYMFLNNKQDKENGILIFVTFYRTLNDIHDDSKIFNENYINLTQDNYNGIGIILPSNIIDKKYKVYYTTTKFKKIASATEKELDDIIKNSHLMYEN